MNKQILILTAAVALTAPSALANNKYPTNAFDAHYKVTTSYNGSGGASDLRLASDGKGHMLTQSSASGYTSSTIVDYPNDSSTTLIEQGKIAMKSKLPADGGYCADEASVKSQGGKLIGQKVVGGHPCHGYEYKTPSGKTQCWIGDDVKVLVMSITEMPTGKSTMELKSVGGAPSSDVFKIPSGYKMMSQ